MKPKESSVGALTAHEPSRSAPSGDFVCTPRIQEIEEHDRKTRAEEEETDMTRNTCLTFGLIVAMGIGSAGLASASDSESDATQPRRGAIQGRSFVWKTPVEKPYALTGEERRQTERDRDADRPAFHHHGRSGSEFR
jgi:hypothetical protein